MRQGLDSAACSDADWVYIELCPFNSGMLQGRDAAAMALTDSTSASQLRRVTPCVTEAGFVADTSDSAAAAGEPALW